MRVGNSFLYNATQYVQEHTLLNRGMIDLGGCGIPHALKSNNKTEAAERLSMSSILFSLSFLGPLVLLPMFNKRALLKNGIVKNFSNNEKKIIQVSKEFLNKDVDKMVKGIQETGKRLNCEKDFNNILERFPDKEVLRQKLLKAHNSIMKKDFLSTAWQWCSTPYIVTEITEKITHKKGFSATYEMGDTKQLSDKEYQKQKHRKMLSSALLATVPSILIPTIIHKGIKNPNTTNKILKSINKNAKLFDYTQEVNMPKIIYYSVWVGTSYPSKVIASRDKNERKDRFLRDGALIGMYSCGDSLINNVLGRASDKFLKTKIMDTDKLKGKKNNFFTRFKMPLKNFRDVEYQLKGESYKLIKRTQNAGAGIYWVSLLTNMGLIGFALPTVLNKILKKSVKKDKIANKNNSTTNIKPNIIDKK